MYCACQASFPGPDFLIASFLTHRFVGRLLVSPPLGGSTTKSICSVICSPLALLVATKVTGKIPISDGVPANAPLPASYVIPGGNPVAEYETPAPGPGFCVTRRIGGWRS